MHLRTVLWAVLAGTFVAVSSAQLSAPELESLDSALAVGNLKTSDLAYPRRSYKVPIGMDGLKVSANSPIECANTLLSLHNLAITKGGSSLLFECVRSAYGKADALKPLPKASITYPNGFPSDFAASLTRLIDAIKDANASIREATAKLTAEQRRELVESLPTLASEGLLKVVFARKDFPSASSVDSLLRNVDLAKIRGASIFLAQAVENEAPQLRKMKAKYSFDGILKTKLGGLTVEISGKDNYTFASSDASLGVALGARSKITGRYAAGVGYASAFIDLSPESTYDVPDASAGCGILGVGVHYLGGNRHSLRGRSLCFGSGLAGVGVFIADGGQNSYDSLGLSQGFGMFGIGLLHSKGGENTLRARAWSQGASRSGGIGWLAIQAGRNQLRAGQFLVAPESEGSYRSYSQGYSGGISDLGGGIGMLTLNGGEDSLSLDLGGQGAGFDSGVGSIFLAGKRSRIVAQGQAIGYGARSGAGFAFMVGSGFSHVLEQSGGLGYGLEEGVGFLLSRGNREFFATGDGRMGSAASGGVGLFVQNGDDNRFLGMSGIGDPSPESSAVGAFVAMGSGNQFQAGLLDGQASLQGATGITIGGEQLLSKPDEMKPLPPVGSEPFASESEIPALSNQLDAHLARFVASGKSGLTWLLQGGLPIIQEKYLREVAFLVNANGADGQSLLLESLKSKDVTTLRRAWRIVALAKFKPAAPLLAEALRDSGTQEEAARAAGALGAADTVDILIGLCAPTSGAARAAMSSLAQIGDERAVPTAQALVLSEDMPVRRSAIALLTKFPQSAVATAKNLTATGEGRSRMIGLELCRLAGTPDAMEIAGGFLSDPNPTVRAQAALALNGRCPAKYRAALFDLKRDQNPMVRAVAARAEIGR